MECQEWRSDGINRTNINEQNYLYGGNTSNERNTEQNFVNHQRTSGFVNAAGTSRHTVGGTLDSNVEPDVDSPCPTYYDLDEKNLYTPPSTNVANTNNSNFNYNSGNNLIANSPTYNSSNQQCAQSPLINNLPQRDIKCERSVISPNDASNWSSSSPIPANDNANGFTGYPSNKLFYHQNQQNTVNRIYPNSNYNSNIGRIMPPIRETYDGHQMMSMPSHHWSGNSSLDSSSLGSASLSSPPIPGIGLIEKKKRGRPCGSKNKPKQQQQQQMPHQQTPVPIHQQSLPQQQQQVLPTASHQQIQNQPQFPLSFNYGNINTTLYTNSSNSNNDVLVIDERMNLNEKSNEKCSSPGKRRKKTLSEEIGVNTHLSLNCWSNEQLGIIKPQEIPTQQTQLMNDQNYNSNLNYNFENGNNFQNKNEVPVNNSIGNVTNVSKKKPWGPYVRMERDNKNDQTIYTIVNVQKLDEDKDQKKNKSMHDNQSKLLPYKRPSLSKKKLVTLSQQMDTLTRDTSWICALCKQGPHYNSLGDLYGPYFVKVEQKYLNLNGDANDNKLRSPKKSSENLNEKKVKSFISANNYGENNGSTIEQQEVWFHEDCLVWSNGVYLAGNEIRNIDEIVKDSQETMCTGCKLTGATLGCLHKGCLSRFHYLCAQEKGCKMNEENFSIYCTKHKAKLKETSY